MNNKGKIYVVGIGPGNYEHMTGMAIKAIEESDIVVGYSTYLDIIKDLIKDKKTDTSGMKKERERCLLAIDYAKEGNIVAMVSSGDPGVYGMAGLILELISDEIEVEIVPGVSAANASAAALGAPLMHDYVVISLSDLLTDYELIKRRIDAAGRGDFVVAIYNPRSKKRVKQIEDAREILLKYKKKNTPVGIVKNAKRVGENVVITTLDTMLEHEIDMFTTVIVGNNNSYIKDGKMVTPRGYKI
ncbi:precorrin-3B C(17)-methyltransferase [Helicovermis profundi]|uniref:Precorrin-3B C(17)-methyltransferase n=1 Tax=Helicovermis profundi TaxID=3065157 RepID=A0AAU9EBY0_9FIRM|nr:precorrin-3B C(17)-methyltransferase [Clostridia bacterium S502]